MTLVQTWFLLSVLLPSLWLISAQHGEKIFNRHPGRTSATVKLEPIIFTPRTTTPCPVTYKRDPPQGIILNFSKTGLKRISDLFVRSPNVIELNLDNNEISEISSMAFEELPRLEVLQVCGNKIPIEKLLWFKTHTAVKELVIDDNKYYGNETSIDRILQPLTRLRTLSLRRDRISHLNINVKEFAPYLTRLDLSGNSIESVDFLANLPDDLSHLYLDDNAISSLNRDNLDNIVELSISGNRIKELCIASCADFSLSLQRMRQLSKLNASRNSISTVAENTFVDTKSLSVLDLSGNEIRLLPNDIFDGLVFMQHLDLSHNQFTSVPQICKLLRLTHLDLSYNHIAEVASDTFCQLTEIKTLLLSNNHIINVDSTAIVALQGIRTLDLSSNVIDVLPVNLIWGTRYLEVLSLRNNSIMNMDQLFEDRSSSLKELHLEDNPLPSLKSRHMPQLTVHLKGSKLNDADDNADDDSDLSVELHETDDPVGSNAVDDFR